MSKPTQEVQTLSKKTADALDLHAKNIRSYLKGVRKGAAELASYAYLVGRECLAAKETIAHGNTGGDANAGLKKFLSAAIPGEPYSTLTRWMGFTKLFNEHPRAVEFLKKRSLLLTKPKLSMKERFAMAEVVPLIMDGKGMMQFTRDCRLLRDAEKPKHHPRKQVDPDKAAAARRKQAESFFKGVLSDLDLAQDHLKYLETQTLQSTLDHLVDVSNGIRELLKTRKGN